MSWCANLEEFEAWDMQYRGSLGVVRYLTGSSEEVWVRGKCKTWDVDGNESPS